MQGTSMHESKAADVWACGVALFTMLTNADPFDNAAALRSTPRTPRAAACAKGHEWPPGRQPSEACQELVAQMLQPDPLQRASVEQVMQHRWYLADLPRELQARASGREPLCMRHAHALAAV